MSEENMEAEEERKGFFEWIRSHFRKDTDEVEEAPAYKRKILDGRIEKYLDQNMSGYIQEYGIITGLDLESYEMRYKDLTSRISGMKEYMIDSDAMVSAMEKEIAEVQKASRKK